MIDKYLIILLNCASPKTDYAFGLVEDENDNTVVFDTYEDARDWIRENKGGPFAFAIIATSDFIYH